MRETTLVRNFVLRRWKGYDFNVLDALLKKGYIGGSCRTRSVFLTDEGKKTTEKLEQALLPKIEAVLLEMRI